MAKKYKHVARNLSIATGVEIASSAGFIVLATSQASQPNPNPALIATELGVASILGTVALFTGIGAIVALIVKNN